MSANAELNISLEPHLVETLEAISPLLPDQISPQLAAALLTSKGTSSASTVPYSLLSAISSWVRTSAGQTALAGHTPPLAPHDYTMIALLAGTKTSPERKFPSDESVIGRDGEADAARERNDRRAVTAVVNALLSIGGSGAATWWAAGRLAWKDEWKVLLSLFVAIVVATSEAILYMIWDARRSKSKHPFRRPLAFRHTRSSVRAKEPPAALSPKSGALDLSAELDDINASQPIVGTSASSDIQEHQDTRGLRERIPQKSRSRRG